MDDMVAAPPKREIIITDIVGDNPETLPAESRNRDPKDKPGTAFTMAHHGESRIGLWIVTYSLENLRQNWATVFVHPAERRLNLGLIRELDQKFLDGQEFYTRFFKDLSPEAANRLFLRDVAPMISSYDHPLTHPVHRFNVAGHSYSRVKGEVEKYLKAVIEHMPEKEKR